LALEAAVGAYVPSVIETTKWPKRPWILAGAANAGPTCCPFCCPTPDKGQRIGLARLLGPPPVTASQAGTATDDDHWQVQTRPVTPEVAVRVARLM